jgi:hypothetical protein
VYKNLVAEGEKLYYEKPDYWKSLMIDFIERTALHAGNAGLPLVTTECWGIVDYKDWPMLSWDWVKELCAWHYSRFNRSAGWPLRPVIFAGLSLLACGAMWSGTAALPVL